MTTVTTLSTLCSAMAALVSRVLSSNWHCAQDMNSRLNPSCQNPSGQGSVAIVRATVVPFESPPSQPAVSQHGLWCLEGRTPTIHLLCATMVLADFSIFLAGLVKRLISHVPHNQKSLLASQADPMAFVQDMSQALAASGASNLLASSTHSSRAAKSVASYTSLIRYFGRPILPPKVCEMVKLCRGGRAVCADTFSFFSGRLLFFFYQLTAAQRTEMAVLRAQALRRQLQREQQQLERRGAAVDADLPDANQKPNVSASGSHLLQRAYTEERDRTDALNGSPQHADNPPLWSQSLDEYNLADTLRQATVPAFWDGRRSNSSSSSSNSSMGGMDGLPPAAVGHDRQSSPSVELMRARAHQRLAAMARGFVTRRVMATDRVRNICRAIRVW